MYVSNESATLVDVYFHAVVMTQTKSTIVKYNACLPMFGMGAGWRPGQGGVGSMISDFQLKKRWK
jgi:hypothetical protein